MQIRVIATGSTKWQRFIRRWGVSFLIGEDILFDTFGDSGVFLNNIRRLNINTDKIVHIVLSHDDWDHITGLWSLIPNRNDITVYVCPGFKQEIKDRIISSGVKLVEAKEAMPVKENVYLTGELSGGSEGRTIYEQSVVIKTADGLAVLCGCAHPGLVDIVRYVKERFHENVYLLIGGFHLKDNTNDKNLRIIKDLRELGVRKIMPMHCTGKRATDAIYDAFGHDCITIGAGSVVEI